jgi:hypothetical protein
MTGYDRKRLALSQAGPSPVNVRVEVDVTGTGVWLPYQTFEVPAGGQPVEHTFPAAFNAYWLRTVADRDCTATAWLEYE